MRVDTPYASLSFILSSERPCHNGGSEEERQLGSKALERGFSKYEELSLAKIEFSSHGWQPLHFKRLKVAAPNLFHPTASPPFRKVVFSY